MGVARSRAPIEDLNMRMASIAGALVGALFLPQATNPQPGGEYAPSPGAIERLPVKEVTIFKNGHAYVVQEGNMPVDATGDVILDQLPAPVMGTFWPYATGGRAKLNGVTVGKRRLPVERTATTMRQLFEANVGADAFITEGGAHYAGTIVSLPSRSIEETASTEPSDGTPVTAPPGNL